MLQRCISPIQISLSYLLAMLVLQLAPLPGLIIKPVLVGLLLAVHGVQLLQVARRATGRLHLQLLVFADLGGER